MSPFKNNDKAKKEVISLLQTLIKNACVNDGEHAEEMRSIETLAKYFDSYGISYEIFESTPGRGNLLSTYGEGSPRVMLGPSHVDVVPATDEDWEVPPFSGEIKDDMIWGRGALDMLSVVASQAVTYAHLVTDDDFKPKGTLMFAAVADEEAGGKWGVKWLLENHYEKFKADYTLSEAGGFSLEKGSKKFLFQVGEKGLYPLTIRAKGIQGHGSMPLASDNALVKITDAMTRLAKYQPPIETQQYWKDFVKALGLPKTSEFLLTHKSTVPMVVKKLKKQGNPMAAIVHALTQMTISPNNIKGTIKFNVIPGDVIGEVDIRLLPGQDEEYAMRHVKKALGKELVEQLEFHTDLYNPGNASPYPTPMWDAMHKAANDLIPNSEIIPIVIPGVTDSRYYRVKGTISYGAALFDPNDSMKDYMNLIHGKNERISINSLWLTTQFFAKTMHYMLNT